MRGSGRKEKGRKGEWKAKLLTPLTHTLTHSTQVLLYASSVDLRVLYTPSLYWSPHIATGPSAAYRKQTRVSNSRICETSLIQPPLTFPQAAVLACGHSIEACLTTDVTIAIGVEQLACLVDTVSSNSLTHTGGGDEGKTSTQASDSHVPLKVLLTGQTVSLVLLTEGSNVPMAASRHVFEYVAEQTSSDSSLGLGLLQSNYGEATPLLQASLFNPLLSAQTGGGAHRCWEVSCFNMAVSGTEEPIPVGEH